MSNRDVARIMDRMPRFMHPEGVPDRVETWADLLYQVSVEIDLAEEGELGWTRKQFATAYRYRELIAQKAVGS